MSAVVTIAEQIPHAQAQLEEKTGVRGKQGRSKMRGAKTGDSVFGLQGESVAVSLFCIVRAAYIKRIWIKSFFYCSSNIFFSLFPFSG